MSERLGPLEFLGRVEDVDGDSCHSLLRDYTILGCSSPNIHQHMNVVFFRRESFKFPLVADTHTHTCIHASTRIYALY